MAKLVAIAVLLLLAQSPAPAPPRSPVPAIPRSPAPAPPRAPAPAPQAGRDAAPAASGAVAGTVTDKETARPLADVIVTLQAADGSQPREQVTNAEGQFEFTGVAAGTYALWARPDEHRFSYLAQAYGQEAPFDRFIDGRPPGTLAVKSGERVTAIAVALGRALAIEGRVVDQWDEPMTGVNVTATRADRPQITVASVSTDDRGVYRLFGLLPGTYHVCARPEHSQVPSAGEPARYARTCHPAAIVEAQAGDVSLTARDAVNIDIRPQGVRSYTLSGTVLDASGAPVDGAQLHTLSLDDEPAAAHTKSKAGAFELQGVTAGRYLIVASIGGPETPDDRRPPTRAREQGFSAIDVTGGDVNGLAITMAKLATLSGRVVFDGAPAPPATALRMVVRTRHAGRGLWRLDPPAKAPVGDNLAFQLADIDRLPLVVGIAELPKGWALQSVLHDGRDITHVPTEFTTASAPAPLRIVLTNRVAQPSIRILDEQGNPVRGHVVLLPANRAQWAGGWTAEFIEHGVVQLPAMSPGNYLVAALSAADFVVVSRNPDRIGDLATVATPMTFAAGDRNTYDLAQTRMPAK